MRVLLDESLPRQLAFELVGHEVVTVPQQGWAGTQDGVLLRLAKASGFEAFITADQNLPHEQPLGASGLVVIIMVGRTNRLPDLLPLVAKALQALSSLRSGQWLAVDASQETD